MNRLHLIEKYARVWNKAPWVERLMWLGWPRPTAGGVPHLSGVETNGPELRGGAGFVDAEPIREGINAEVPKLSGTGGASLGACETGNWPYRKIKKVKK